MPQKPGFYLNATLKILKNLHLQYLDTEWRLHYHDHCNYWRQLTTSGINQNAVCNDNRESQSENFQTKKGELTLPIRRLGTTISLQRSWRGAKQSKGQGKKEKGESVPLHIFCQNPGWPEAISEVSAKGSLVSESTLLSHKLWWEIPSSTNQHKKLSQRCQANT